MHRLLTGALAALATFAAAPVASAEITVTYDAGSKTIGIVGTGAENTTYLRVDGGQVTIQNSSGMVNASGDCTGPTENAPLGFYIYCPGAAEVISASYGAGNDKLFLENMCIGTVTAALGDGANEFSRPQGCPADQSATVGGGSGNDQFSGGSGPDSFGGGGGDDVLRGYGGGDTLLGGDGNDQLEGHDGDDTLDGGPGDDTLRGGAGNDSQSGGDGNDVLGSGDADAGADDLRGGPGIDTLDLIEHARGVTVTLDDVQNDGVPGEGDNVHTDIEKIFGTQGNDTIVGSNAGETIDAHFGDDVVRGAGGDDSIDGNSGNDQLVGDAGSDTIYGGSGDDRVEGGAGTDSLFGDYASCSAFGCAAGNDQLFARDGEVDALNCGGGGDSAQVDAVDVIGQDGLQQCEAVDRPSAAPGPGTGTPTPGTTTSTSALAAGSKITAGKRRFTVSFTLRRAATVTLTVTKKGARKALGKVTIKAKKGKTTRRITKVGKRKLARGTYKVVLRAGAASKTFTVKVR